MNSHKGAITIGHFFVKTARFNSTVRFMIIVDSKATSCADIERITGWGKFIIIVPFTEIIHYIVVVYETENP